MLYAATARGGPAPVQAKKLVMIDTDRPTITPEPKEHESDSEVEIADWSIYAD